MDSIYSIIRSALGENSKLPPDFNILRIVQGEAYPPDGEDGVNREFTEEGVREGEFDSVIVRIPARFTHHLVVNLHMASVLKKGVIAYDKLQDGSLPEKKQASAEKKVAAAEAIIEKYEPVTVADKVLSQMVNIRTPRDKIAAFGRHLATEGTTVNAVKLGIAMIGFFGEPGDKEVITVLGKSEELAYFASKALASLLKDEKEFTDACMEIVKANRGWGKISAVLDLPDAIEDPAHRIWLLAHGCENVLGFYHLAVECAVKGNLGDYLLECVNDKSVIDQETAAGICDIIEGLFQAEEVPEADSFSEINDIGTLLSSFSYCVRSGLLSDERTEEIIAKLIEKKYLRAPKESD